MADPDMTFASSQIVVEGLGKRLKDGEELRSSAIPIQIAAKRIPDVTNDEMELRPSQIMISVLAKRATDEGLWTLAQNGTFW